MVDENKKLKQDGSPLLTRLPKPCDCFDSIDGTGVDSDTLYRTATLNCTTEQLSYETASAISVKTSLKHQSMPCWSVRLAAIFGKCIKCHYQCRTWYLQNPDLPGVYPTCRFTEDPLSTEKHDQSLC